ncbi:hypothetical protein SBOR_6763 [Sclerotinia borealis F-4128]|uniref:Uncharacterized protein n=1 Tax=Sclerotinia borealis (strain F-4128) TaxID=1432307 RepID=W9CEA1_SCLBF|nr:hypothetical protein SBOR_6763 [Sclerotinia borealis F-4128]
MSQNHGNASGNQNFALEDPVNQVVQSLLETMQRKIEQQHRQLEQQDRRINQLNQYIQKLEKEHAQHIQSCRVQNQQFTMHIQSHQLRIQQLFALQAGGLGHHEYGPPPLPDVARHWVPPPPPPDVAQHWVPSPSPPPSVMTRYPGQGIRRERRQSSYERDRSRSPDRGDGRYPDSRREGRFDGPRGADSELGSSALCSMPGELGRNVGGATFSTSIPLRPKVNSMVDKGESQSQLRDESEGGIIKREIDG